MKLKSEVCENLFTSFAYSAVGVIKAEPSYNAMNVGTEDRSIYKRKRKETQRIHTFITPIQGEAHTRIWLSEVNRMNPDKVSVCAL